MLLRQGQPSVGTAMDSRWPNAGVPLRQGAMVGVRTMDSIPTRQSVVGQHRGLLGSPGGPQVHVQDPCGLRMREGPQSHPGGAAEYALVNH